MIKLTACVIRPDLEVKLNPRTLPIACKELAATFFRFVQRIV
jgi:hypothetical protein